MAKDSEQINIMSLTKKKIRVIEGDHHLLESKNQAERTQQVKEIIYNSSSTWVIFLKDSKGHWFTTDLKQLDRKKNKAVLSR